MRDNLMDPTEHSTVLEPQNPQINASVQHKFRALELWNSRSGREDKYEQRCSINRPSRALKYLNLQLKINTLLTLWGTCGNFYFASVIALINSAITSGSFFTAFTIKMELKRGQPCLYFHKKIFSIHKGTFGSCHNLEISWHLSTRILTRPEFP